MGLRRWYISHVASEYSPDGWSACRRSSRLRIAASGSDRADDNQLGPRPFGQAIALLAMPFGQGRRIVDNAAPRSKQAFGGDVGDPVDPDALGAGIVRFGEQELANEIALDDDRPELAGDSMGQIGLAGARQTADDDERRRTVRFCRGWQRAEHCGEIRADRAIFHGTVLYRIFAQSGTAVQCRSERRWLYLLTEFWYNICRRCGEDGRARR